MTTTTTTQITIRRSRPDDALALRRLAALDSARYDGGPALMAESGGELLAARPLDGGPVLADPFRRTAELVALLELRADQLADSGELAARRARRDGERRLSPAAA